MFNAGDHVPVMPLVEVVGKAAKAEPEQIGATGLNEGIVAGVTVMVNVAEKVHCPVLGVKI